MEPNRAAFSRHLGPLKLGGLHLLESFLFYSGFYLPLYCGRVGPGSTNTAPT